MTSTPYSFSGTSTPEAESSSGVEVVEEAQATRKSTVAEHTIMSRAAYLDLLRCVLWVSIRQGDLSRKQENGLTIRPLIEFVGGAPRVEAVREGDEVIRDPGRWLRCRGDS